MTYEEKMLSVFARFRGASLDERTLRQIEKACQEEVWQHLPPRIRNSWQLHLALSQTSPPEIELRPEKTGTASAADLETALREPFQEQPPASGGIMGFSLNFSGDAPGTPAPVAKEDPTPSRTPVEQRPHNPEQESPPAPNHSARTCSTSGSAAQHARDVEAQAKELGISLPSNSSLLQPFLEALAAASEYKRRAEAAEAELDRLRSRS